MDKSVKVPEQAHTKAKNLQNYALNKKVDISIRDIFELGIELIPKDFYKMIAKKKKGRKAIK